MKKAFITISLLLNMLCAYNQNTQYDSLKTLISSAKDDSTKFYKTVDLIWAYIYSIPDSAVLYVQQNILLAQKMKSDQALFKGYAQYSILEQINGNYTGALQYGLQALRIAERTKNFISICEAYFVLANIYSEAENYPQAIYNVRKAKSLLESKLNRVFEEEKNQEAAAHYVNCLVLAAQTFEAFNQLDSALKYANTAHDLSLKGFGKWATPKDTLFFSLNLAPLMGNIYSKTGDYSTALNYYRSGAALAAGNKDLMDNYNGVANIFKKVGQLDSSILYANKVLELSKSAHFPIGKLEALILLSDVYKLKHNTDSVAKYLQLTIETKDSLFNTKKVMEIQSISFNEQLRQQEIKDQQQQYQDRLRTYMLAGGLIVVLLLAGILYRNNLQKQKAKEKIEEAYGNLKATQQQLIQSEKMASLGELTAGIAHEIQNPLNFVNNFSEVNKEMLEELKAERLKPKAERDEQAQDEIINDVIENEEKINHHGKRADAIVKNMLQHSRKSEGKKQPTDINALCDEYLRLSYHGLRAKDKNFNAEIKTDFDESIGKINIIPQDIGRVLLNLFNNAFYAVNEKKKLLANSYQPLAEVKTRRINDKVEIIVSDNGVGIPQKVVDKIFQPFFTTKPTGQGTGLGLSLSYDIIKAHGGEIKVETKESEGTTFIIQLPNYSS
jgi:two-component system NtrC family sensor kinase